MSFSVSPSVTVREVDATAVVPAILSAPAAIAGVFRWGPVLERVLVTSEDDLVHRFGKPTPLNPETFFTAADYLSYSNALYVARVDNGANTAQSNTFSAKYPGALGNGLGVSFTNKESFERSIVNEGSGEISINSSLFTITSTDAEFLSTGAGTPGVEFHLNENDILRVGNVSVGYQNLVVDDISVAVVTDTAGAVPVNTYTYTINFKNRYSLAEELFENLELTRRWGFSSVVEGVPDDNNIHIVVYDASGDITGVPRTVIEVYDNVSLNPGTFYSDGTNNYYVDVIANRSAYVLVKENITLGDFAYENLIGGSDGLSEASIALGPIASGYDLFKEPSELDISFVLSGKTNSAALPNYIVANIAEYRKDCIVAVSPSNENVIGVSNANVQLNNVISFRNQMQSSSYWIMDTGYKYRFDKYNDVYRWVPLNGDIAGLMARVDPWESPAGFKRGLIKNVVKLAFNPNKPQRDVLYGKDINPVITQAGQGTLLFGDKTGIAQPQSAFSRINVRRLFLTVEKAIATVSQSLLFDFNDEFTQSQFVNMVEPFLRDIQGKRGIIDFRVIADSTINTPDVIDRNMFRANIFIKPARTISYIELTFIATRTGIEFEEIVGQQF